MQYIAKERTMIERKIAGIMCVCVCVLSRKIFINFVGDN